MMAMQAVAEDDMQFGNCTHARRADIRSEALEVIFNAPYVFSVGLHLIGS